MKAVIFDMDGVILDSEKHVLAIWKEMGEKYGFDNVEAMCKKTMGTNINYTKETWLNYYGEDFPYDKYRQEVSETFHSRFEKGVPLKPGVFELFDALKEHKIKIALATSTRYESAKKELETLGLWGYFNAVCTGDKVTHSKPHPEIYLKALYELGVNEDEAIVIEDSHNGVRSAYNANIDVIMVPDLMPVTEEMEKCTIAILDSLLDVKQFLNI